MAFRWEQTLRYRGFGFTVRSHIEEPYRPCWVEGVGDGRALAFGECPGRFDISAKRYLLNSRDLNADLGCLREQGVTDIVCALPDTELETELHIKGYFAKVIEHGFMLWRFVIREDSDSVPAPDQADELRSLVQGVTERLKSGSVVLVHCRNGEGRSATLAGCLMKSFGFSAGHIVEQFTRLKGEDCPKKAVQRDYLHKFSEAVPQS
ncbi:dual specificity protein phosphatase family protein [Parendozoicomonas haliclonae]|nr:dual specificity protein phosphatase family protein [Parendozoicomonas haliclonae]